MYKENVVRKLKNYSVIKFQQQFLQMRIEGLKDRYNRLPAQWPDKEAKASEIARLESVYRDNALIIADVEQVLDYLPEKEKLVLWHFYINRTHDYIEILSEKLCIERTRIYRLKDKALETFALLDIGKFY